MSKKVIYTIQLPKWLHEWLKVKSTKEGETISTVIRRVLAEEMKKDAINIEKFGDK